MLSFRSLLGRGLLGLSRFLSCSLTVRDHFGRFLLGRCLLLFSSLLDGYLLVFDRLLLGCDLALDLTLLVGDFLGRILTGLGFLALCCEAALLGLPLALPLAVLA